MRTSLLLRQASAKAPGSQYIPRGGVLSLETPAGDGRGGMEGVEGRGEEGARGNTLSSVQYQVGVRTHSAAPQGEKRGRDTLKCHTFLKKTHVKKLFFALPSA